MVPLRFSSLCLSSASTCVRTAMRGTRCEVETMRALSSPLLLRFPPFLCARCGGVGRLTESMRVVLGPPPGRPGPRLLYGGARAEPQLR